MTESTLLYLVVGLVGPWLLHRIGAVDLSGLFPSLPGTPKAPTVPPAQLPPPLVPLANRPTLQLLEQELEAKGLELLRAHIQGLLSQAAPPLLSAPPAPAAK